MCINITIDENKQFATLILLVIGNKAHELWIWLTPHYLKIIFSQVLEKATVLLVH